MPRSASTPAFVLAALAAAASGAQAVGTEAGSHERRPTAAVHPAPPTPHDEPDAGLPWPARIAARLEATAPLADLPAPPGRARGPRVAGGAAIFAVDLTAGRVLASRSASAPRNPASNLKVVTAAAAVELLGPEYRFATRLLRAGDTLYLRGEGDPSLLVDDLYALARAVHASGQLEGVRRIVADDSAFGPRRFGPGYDRPGDDAYLAPSGALSLQFNTVEIRVAPQAGPRPRVAVAPAGSGLTVDNRARLVPGAASKLHLEVVPDPRGHGTRLRVSGVMGRGAPPARLRRRVLDPARYTAGAFAHVLADVMGRPPLPVTVGPAPEGALELARHDSAPLSEVLGAALKYSNNFTAEQVLRTLAWRATGRPGTWPDGVALVRRWWRAIGQDPADLALENASGLSARTRLSPRGLVAVLARVARDGSPSHALLPALSVAGRDGTLRGRLPVARERLRGKTGTLHGVSTLSGLAQTPGGHEIAFAVFMNNVHDTGHARREQDRLLAAMLVGI